MERTLIILKPDAIKRNLEKDIKKKYESVGLKMIERKEITPDPKLLRDHYSAHTQKPFYPNLETFMLSGPIVAMIWEGENAISVARKITGATNPAQADEGTVRGDFRDTTLEGEDAITKNMVHASATTEEAEKEISLWFPDL